MYSYPKQLPGPTPKPKVPKARSGGPIIPKGVPASGMIQLTQRKLVSNGIEEHIFFLAVSDISSLMLMDTDEAGRPMKCTHIKLKSGGWFNVKQSPLEVRGLMSKAF